MYKVSCLELNSCPKCEWIYKGGSLPLRMYLSLSFSLSHVSSQSFGFKVLIFHHPWTYVVVARNYVLSHIKPLYLTSWCNGKTLGVSKMSSTNLNTFILLTYLHIFSLANVSSVNLCPICFIPINQGSSLAFLIWSLESSGNCVATGFTFLATVLYLMFKFP